MELPAIVSFKSEYNNKYLRYRNEEDQTNGLLQFSGEKAMDALAQFEVIPATDDVDRGLVHLKSRYTNKYLVRWSPTQNWITAAARKPNEDVTNWACTLFKPSIYTTDGTMEARLMHVQLGRFARLAITQPPFDNCLLARSDYPDPDSGDIFIVTDWASILNLPRKVAFKGDNGKYLGLSVAKGISYLQFSYDDSNYRKISHEIFSCFDGTIMMKSVYNNKFWRLGADDLIVADHVEPSSGNTSTMFRVTAIDANVVALLNMNNTLYCKRSTESDAQDSLLKAATQNVDASAVLQVKDLSHLS